ncbi:MAG TPA: O-antigen ligase family protein [Candidatus Moranbacteria bacterium]|mgnify:CR=1 FL=1|nr:O-antigen ligase family protein [Candidatus Moranbacteria bacterium]
MFQLFCFLVLYLPFQLALNPASGVDLASIRVAILAVFLLWLAEGLKKRKITIYGGIIPFFLLSFLFLGVISVFWAQNLEWSGRKLMFLFSIFPVYFVAGAVIKNKEKALKVIKMLIWGGTTAAILGIFQFAAQFVWGLDGIYNFWAEYVIWPFLGESFSRAVLENPSWLVNISGRTYLRATAIFPDPHMFSFFLGLLIPLTIGAYLEKRNKTYLFSFFVLLLADILTFSRGGYLGLTAGILFLIFIFWKKIARKFRLFLLALIFLAVLALLIPSPVSSRFQSIFNFQEGSNKGRMETWKQAAEVIWNNPIMGVGIGNYPLEIKATADYREPIYAHNTYLDIAAETGLVSLLFWLLVLGTALATFLKKARRSPLFLFCALSIIIFSAHSLVETAIYSPVVLTLFLIILSFSGIKETDEKNI